LDSGCHPHYKTNMTDQSQKLSFFEKSRLQAADDAANFVLMTMISFPVEILQDEADWTHEAAAAAFPWPRLWDAFFGYGSWES